MKSTTLLLFLLIAIKPALVLAKIKIEIDPSRATGARVQHFGWDLKGWKDNASTRGRAAKLYRDTPANIVRIPIEAFAHGEDGSIKMARYGSMLKSIANIRAFNPDVKIFAGIKLAKATTFPKWVESEEDGSIFEAKVKRPVPQKYAQIVADYVDWLRKEEIAIDFLGLNNEITGALTPDRYIATARALNKELADRKIPQEYRSFRYVGAEAFGVATSLRYAKAIKAGRGLEFADIWGSHFYPDHKSGSIDDWRQLSAVARGCPLWHTELHVRSSPDPAQHVAKVRDGLAILFATNQVGAEGYIWWAQGYQDHSVDPIRRKAITSLLGGSCIYTSGQYKAKGNKPDAHLAQATRVGKTAWVWFFNPRSELRQLPILLKHGSAVQASCEYWAGGNAASTMTSGTLTVNSRNGKYFNVKDVPATSIILVKLELENPSPLWPQNDGDLVAEREWRPRDPRLKSIRAALKYVKDGVAHFQHSSGFNFDYPMNKLSDEDRQIVNDAMLKKGH